MSTVVCDFLGAKYVWNKVMKMKEQQICSEMFSILFYDEKYVNIFKKLFFFNDQRMNTKVHRDPVLH